MLNRVQRLLGVSALLVAFGVTVAHAKTVTVTFNQLEIGLDDATGGIVSMKSPYSKPLITSSVQQAGMLDVAYPLETFAPMRLSSRFSSGAKIQRKKDSVTISWEKLGASRANLALPTGVVRGEVTISAAPDGRSVIFQARVRNDSALAVPQVLFPDLAGLRPVGGEADTRLRLARDVLRPFAKPVTAPERAPFYAATNSHHQSGIAWQEYPPDGYYGANSLRWLDFGGYDGGLSVFQRKWGSFDWPTVLTRRSEADPSSLHLVWAHRSEIQPGASWTSGEFWFTPHAGGWAKGIEVYREYVAGVTPQNSLPKHVREDIGAQTIWMIQTAEVDPAMATFRFSDLPRVAEDARRYGIHEVIPWGWCVYSTMPIPVREELGTVDDFVAGVKKSRELGVNVTPFISLAIVRNMYAGRYGVEPANADWTYHDELVPMFRPFYTKFWNGVEIDGNNEVWKKDVLDSLTQWIDRGVTSFSWDVFKVHERKDGAKPAIFEVVEAVRKRARAVDPQSVFSGESVDHLEHDSQSLDYLWNWSNYEDAGPITNVLRAPRVTCTVESSPLVVAKCFADNLYLNVMPRKPDAPNGTALISEKPQLAAAVLQAAKLRKQFLPYFVDGAFLGDSILTAPSNGFVRAHQLKDRVLIIALNDSATPQSVNIQADLGLWLPKASGYAVTRYDASGSRQASNSTNGDRWVGETAKLDSGEMALLEITTTQVPQGT